MIIQENEKAIKTASIIAKLNYQMKPKNLYEY